MSTPERPDLPERPAEADPGSPPEGSPLWLKLAVAVVAVVVVFLGLEVYRTATSTSIGAVAADFCQTKSEIRASIVKVQASTTDAEFQQNSQEALDPQAADQAAGRATAAVEAIQTYPDIHTRCT